ncbi:MAG: thioredoxin domain-containing protein [Deltaproteobacteria bacterium]|nr:thioredoxin domain-containing protein [Deltaproteobacteria bacterium]
MNNSTEPWSRGIFGGTFRPALLRPVILLALSALALSQPGTAASKPQTSGVPLCSDTASNTVLARVGDHPVTQGEVDTKIAQQLYDLRKQALDDIIDQYLLRQAAQKVGLSPADYVNRQVRSTTPRVTADEAQHFYGEHKAQLDARTGGHSFSQIESRLIAALQRQRDEDVQQELIRKLRAQNHVSVLLEAPHMSVASAGHPSTGATSAPVTVIEFSDFQCPFCRAAESSIKQVRQKYGDQVRLVYMDFPLGFHPHAMDAARAGRCAAEQGKFWQFHDALFLDQKKLDPEGLKQTARRVGLDADKFNTCFSSDRHSAGIRQDMAEGTALGVTGTPTFFINGRELVGAQPPPKFDEVIDEELARAQAAASPRQAMK